MDTRALVRVSLLFAASLVISTAAEIRLCRDESFLGVAFPIVMYILVSSGLLPSRTPDGMALSVGVLLGASSLFILYMFGLYE